MRTYRITREEEFNPYGIGEDVGFYIQEKKTFLYFFKYWIYIGYNSRKLISLYRKRNKFDSMHVAEAFIRNVLSSDKARNKTSIIIMKNIKC